LGTRSSQLRTAGGQSDENSSDIPRSARRGLGTWLAFATQMRTFRDFRFAIRNLTRSLGFTTVVVLTLGAGIGASTAIFSVVNTVLLRPLDYPEPDALVRIGSELRGFNATDTGVATAELFDYQSRNDLFTGVAGILPISANVTGGEMPARVEMMLVSPSYFSVLGVSPAYGRVFGPSDDGPGVASVAVVSDGFWRRHLKADPNAIGSTVTIDADPVVVVGIMPVSFRHPGRTLQNEVEVWSPSGFGGVATAEANRGRLRLDWCLARLRPDVSFEQAQARLADYGATVSRQFPAAYPTQNGWRPTVTTLRDDVVGGASTMMVMLLGGVSLLLLVACVNVAHLVLARSAGRRREIAIRQALGASAGHLMRQFVIESAVLGAAGGLAGLIVASWTLSGLMALAPGRIPRIDAVSIDLTAVLVAAAISCAVTVIFGLVPAWQLRRVDTVAAVKDGGTAGSTSGRPGRAREILVAVEVAMATVLLIAAGLLVRSIVGLVQVPVGFETDSLLTARIELPRPNDTARAQYLDPARRVAFYRETIARIGALPGVERVAMSSQIPLGGFNRPLVVDIQGFQMGDQNTRPAMQHYQVSPNYFETMGMRILRGRSFGDTDRPGSEPVALVSDTAARTLWKGQDPIGERVRLRTDGPWITVIGVVSDVLNRRLIDPAQPILYQTLEQSSNLSLGLLIRTRGAAPDLPESLAREIRAIDPELPIYAVRTMVDVIGRALAQRQFLMRLLVAFGAMAAALALLGIYGVMAYAVSQRTREIGIRMAIGARQADMSLMVIRRGLTLTVAGILVGVAASLALSEVVRSQLFGVTPSDPVTIAGVFVLMTIVAAVAAYRPARRAASVDPVVALRAQ
jgi:putative ABC transport system permease protein